MPTYTLSQPKSGFPTIHQHGKPWLAVEDAQKARAIVEAMNRANEPNEQRTRLVVDLAVDDAELRDQLEDLQKQLLADIAAIEAAGPNLAERFNVVEATVATLQARLSMLETRPYSPWTIRGSI